MDPALTNTQSIHATQRTITKTHCPLPSGRSRHHRHQQRKVARNSTLLVSAISVHGVWCGVRAQRCGVLPQGRKRIAEVVGVGDGMVLLCHTGLADPTRMGARAASAQALTWKAGLPTTRPAWPNCRRSIARSKSGCRRRAVRRDRSDVASPAHRSPPHVSGAAACRSLTDSLATTCHPTFGTDNERAIP